MTDTQFTACVRECAAYTDRESYISDMATSSIWGDSVETEIPQERMDAIGAIWDAYNRSIKDISAAAGISNRKLAERFCIPHRTVEDWSRNVSKCPIYVSLMMQRCLGLI